MKNGFGEWFRFITPLLVTIGLYMMSGINGKLSSIDDKLFKHLTNDEIHCPKSLVTTKAEFSIYQTMRDRQMADLKELNIEIKDLLLKHIDNEINAGKRSH